ncbi:metal-dependent phosphohydrolase [Caulobacter phage CcrPW]|uniref:HD domain-containing protein n=1 Tax=Caulobacter phage CcrPW TaxID=2283271 RepID=A0A385EDE4_9CAUD|nr:metal-dependent phosphohydrolase [Caulobacter phage CcrPW]AXQ68758.1 hypothetical protein CcrPW_gp219c [Caulobacter phage CcrPW]
MADPIDFCGRNKVLNPAPGTEDYVRPLFVHGNGIENISCWKLTPEEAAEVARTGEVWFSIASGKTHHPIRLSGLPLMYFNDPDTGEQETYHTDGTHIVEDARRFAIMHHGEQWYDEERKLRHGYHLGKVVQVLRDFGADWLYLVVGWLHDVEEDCWQDEPMSTRRIMVGARYGDEVEPLVWAVTGEMYIDGVKQNRKARNTQQYAKIAILPKAAPVKVADRIANIEACIEFNSPQGPMYLDEIIDFDDNVGIYVSAAMRVRLLTGALRLMEMHGPSRRFDPQELRDRLAGAIERFAQTIQSPSLLAS